MDSVTAQHVGARLLGEVEEESLEELLTTLRTQTLSQTHALSPPLPFASLSALVSKHHNATKSAPPPLLSLSGRYLPFLYHLISMLLAPSHNYTIVLIDADHRFDVTRLLSPSTTSSSFSRSDSTTTDFPARKADLKHLYVYRPPYSPNQAQIKACIDHAREFMVYGSHASCDRVWWGTIVAGGRGGDVNAGWKGWLEVQRAEVASFGLGMSAEEAVEERARRQNQVEGRGWEGRCRVGVYSWKEA